MASVNVDRFLARVDEVVVSAMNEHIVAGAGVGIVHGGEIVYARGFGTASARERRLVTPETVFRIGSISKTFTALGLMRLWDEGRFRLDDPVRDYLTSYRLVEPDPVAPITCRHLLTHTSGIGEFRRLSDLLRLSTVFGLGVKPGREPRSLAEYYGGRLSAEVRPGTKWAYANHGFATLGQLVEDISGEPFAEYMQRRVFEPLDLSHTDYLLGERVRDEAAQGYQLARGRLSEVKRQEIVVRPAGSVYSSLADMTRYLKALLDQGRGERGQVIRPETLRLMLEPQYQLDPRLPAMGLAFVLDRLDGHRVAGHDGGWPGFVSALLFAPDDGFGVVVLANTTSVLPAVLATRLTRQGLGIAETTDRKPSQAVLESPFLWGELKGSYGPRPGLNTNVRIWLGFGGELQVRVKGTHLNLRSLAGAARRGIDLHAVDPNDPLSFEGTQEREALPVVFKRGEAGRVDRVCLGLYELHRRPPLRSLRLRASAGLGLAGVAVLGAVTLALVRWGRGMAASSSRRR